MAGKGDKPRSCFSQKYRDNYSLIDWKRKKHGPDNTEESESIPKENYPNAREEQHNIKCI